MHLDCLEWLETAFFDVLNPSFGVLDNIFCEIELIWIVFLKRPVAIFRFGDIGLIFTLNGVVICDLWHLLLSVSASAPLRLLSASVPPM